MNRGELLDENKQISLFVGLAKSILKFEKENEHNFGNNFSFSGIVMSYYGFDIYIGKIDQVYFLGVTNPDIDTVEYSFFNTKKEFEIYIATEIEKEDRAEFLNIVNSISWFFQL